MKDKIYIKFVGIDRCNRPIFTTVNKKAYYGCINKLFNYDATEQTVLESVSEEDIVYFGNHFDCEPDRWEPGNIEIVKGDE